MTEKEEEYELKIFNRSSARKEEAIHEEESTLEEESAREEESTGSGINKQKENYLDIINIIETLMHNEDFPIKK